MKKFFTLMSIMCLIGILAACGNDDAEKDRPKADEAEDELEMLEVDLDTPKTLDVDEKTTLSAKVTYGDEDVKDADEVQYEIWEKGKKEDSVMHDAKNKKDGTYTLDTSFDHDATYVVQVHVTAREQHNMPKNNITVGEGSDDSEQADGDHHEHKTKGFDMHFSEPTDVKQKEQTDLKVHIQIDDNPLKDADVRYEIWPGDSKKHDWADAKETKDGEYKADYTFNEKGTYHMIIHVENDEDLHEHEEYRVTVK